MLEGLSEGLIIAVANFLLVFLILGGLAGVLFALRKVVLFFEKPAQETTPEPAVVSPETKPSLQEEQIQSHIVAILAAVQEFTGWPPGSFQIDTIEPIQDVLVPAQAHIAAIAAAIHEFSSMSQESLRIVGIRHLGPANAWKMAGRLELMGLDIN